ncbi:MAG: hypothetical protein K2H32_04885 [Muribaculaceae bacterium]|nr:hypothetical protein [Muribaculaceae bacterium]MDE7155358.1 hypothetical protein [Muribaculaceae bacterium]MDE7368899.1 hypothetical protein [Muribaculaceae bacterium]
MANFLFKNPYKKWLLKNNVSESSLNSYCLQTRYPNTSLTFFDVIGSFAYYNENLYAIAAYEKWKNVIETSSCCDKTKLNQSDYLAKYWIFLDTILLSPTRSKHLSKDDKERLAFIKNTKLLEKIKIELGKSIATEQAPSFIQIDGMDSIISKITEPDFIKLAVESSYFFLPELCKTRFNQIVDAWSNNKEDEMSEDYEIKYLPARYSAKDEEKNVLWVQEQSIDLKCAIFRIGNDSCRIFQDGYRDKKKNTNENGKGNPYGGGNGNTRVCQLIKKLTGYDLGATLNKKSFKNFIISHIWGLAPDPRFFTNLFNIAIVPAWANHLLDKDETGALSERLKASFMKVLITYYGLEKYDWGKIGLSFPNDIETHGPYLKGIYHINVIHKLKDGESFGAITKEEVKILK